MARKSRTHIADASRGELDALAPHKLTKEEFGRRLYQLLLEKGWTQAELGRRAGLPRESISKYIRGYSFPTPQSLKPLAAAFGLEPAQLLPNVTHDAIEDDQPSFEMKASSGNPKFMWVRVNRLLTAETATQIAALILNDAADRD